MTARFEVDLDQLADVIDRLERHLDQLAAVDALLARCLHRLHEDWAGSAADAHVAAQARWDDGFSAMQNALAAMRAAAETARANYTTAAEANVALWREVG